jgi:glucose-6-phosphate-specific signal transduction histidine kinase
VAPLGHQMHHPGNRIRNSMRSTAHAAVNRLLRHLKPRFLDELAASCARDEE